MLVHLSYLTKADQYLRYAISSFQPAESHDNEDTNGTSTNQEIAETKEEKEVIQEEVQLGPVEEEENKITN